MKNSLVRIATISLLVLLSFPVSAWSAQVRLATQDERAIVRAVQKTNPAVVSVVVSKDLPILESFFEEERFGNIIIYRERQREIGSELQEIGGGTAFFIRSEGLLITNYHVVEDPAATYSIITNTGESYSVQVINRDAGSDLALLKVQNPDKRFQIIPFSKTDELALGQTVIALGNALGEFRNTVSKGILSGVGRSVMANNGQYFEEVLQTDAAINSGNSGGPLLNSRGELIGVNFSIAVNAENISFAIPLSRVKVMVDAYLRSITGN